MPKRNVPGAGEKDRPHHDLAAFKASFARDRAITFSARRDAPALGMTIDDVAAAIARLEAVQFRKSIASHADDRRWQDVDHLPIGGLVACVKSIDDVVLEFVLLSFKER